MILEQKQTDTNHEILDVIKNRWSPRAFEAKDIDENTLHRLFEAMRWAPSAMNEQPWRVIYTRKGEHAYDQIVQALMPGNQVWATTAPILIVTLVSRCFSKNGADNGSARYDLGQAVGNLSIQATAENLSLHQMGGFYKNEIIKAFNISEKFEPVTVIALGYQGDPDQLPETLRERELAPRIRKPIETFVNYGEFNNL